MKLVKIFGIVMAFHAAAFMFIFAIPGCRSTSKKPAAAAPVIASEPSPVASAEPPASPMPSPEISAVRFSPTRPGTPAATEASAAPAAAAPASYVVAKGDNLWSIAKKQGVSVKQLAAVNKIKTDTPLKLGQKLSLPVKPAATGATSAPTEAPATSSASAPAAAPVTTKSAASVHVVKSGETLGVIAKKYQVKVGDIATANNIADPTKLRVGQSLKIPGSQAPASKTPAPAPVAAPVSAPVFEPAPAAPTAPVSPLLGSPVEQAPAVSSGESPFMTTPSATAADAPVIRVEESGAPRIE